MSKVNEDDTATQTTFGHLKNLFKMLSQKQYKDALYELWFFIKAVCIKLKNIYVKYLKGQYVEIGGKRIPRTILAIIAVFVLYLISPMSCIFNGDSDEPVAEEQADSNIYEKNGIKVYELRKCDMSVCGILEYRGDEDLEKVHIVIGFFDPTGQEVYEGIAEARQIAPNTRSEFSIPAENEFAYFKLKAVRVNPEEDLEAEEKDANKDEED